MKPPATITSTQPASSSDARPYIKWFADITIADIPLVGGKNASLGEMVRELAGKGVKVPDGFAITAAGFRHFIREANLDEFIRTTLADLNTHDMANLSERGHAVRQAIRSASLPTGLQEQIAGAYRQLQGDSVQPLDVAVRSSATAEDLPDASFAGQQETYLNVQGVAALLETCKRCFASLFTDRAISYRVDKGFEHFKVDLSIGVQRMVRSDLACAGVMFTIDTESGFRDAVLISAAYGLGENVVQGSVTPDEYTVFKTTLKTGHRPILQKTIGSKEFKLIYDTGGGKMVKNVPVAPADRAKYALGDDEVLELARWGCIVEDHYSAKRGAPAPMDLEWAKDGNTGELFIVQARPETVQSRKNPDVLETYRLERRSAVLASGRSVGEKIATGRVRVINSAQFIGQFQEGEVDEGRRVQAEMEMHGLRRGENGLEVYVMCEIPSNVILAEEFSEIFDGFSIGSNDLTQLILGVDRDSEIVAPIFDERNPAVKKMIAQVIATCRAKGRKIGICGQAPSDYPEFAKFLVEQGIDSISLNADTVLKTTLAILETEAALRTPVR